MQLFWRLLLVAGCALSLAEEGAYVQQNGGSVASNGVVTFDLGRVSKRAVSDARYSRRYLTEEAPDAPLYRGFGTHFVYVYVGTPRQRVSVIVDTGSHHTAFPCSGCSQCGDHTDLYFNPKQSSTITVPKCGNKNCVFSQSYTEGSMWTAYRVKDRFFIGGETTTMAAGADKHDVDFTFGCQTKETGLFRTQMENGIMGLSADAKTLPNTLYRANLTTTNAFALCFLPTGGVMSLGGSHPHLKQGPMGYAQMTKKSGYFTVKVLSIHLRRAASSELTELKMPMTKLNSGKGVIVDSGTTDSYLPSSISAAFQSLFKKLCGTSYTRSTFTATPEELQNMPTVVFHLQKWDSSGKSGEYVQVEMPPMRYLEKSSKKGSKNLYVFRLYLTERSGGVLGANFMTGQNVEFDQKQQRIGFAPSHCRAASGEPLYQSISKPVKLNKHRLLGGEEGLVGVQSSEAEEGKRERRRLASAVNLRPSGPCSAQCSSHVVTAAANTSTSEPRVIRSVPGFMRAVTDKVYNHGSGSEALDSENAGKIACSISCDSVEGKQVRVVPVAGAGGESTECPVMPWSMCSSGCSQSPEVLPSAQPFLLPPECVRQQTSPRKCWRELCPFHPAKQCATRLSLSLPLFRVRLWNNLWKEDVITALATALKVDPARLDIPDSPRKKDGAVLAVVHLRLDKVTEDGQLVCPALSTRTPSGPDPLRDVFVQSLHQLNSSICGSWEWVRGGNTALVVEAAQSLESGLVSDASRLGAAVDDVVSHHFAV